MSKQSIWVFLKQRTTLSDEAIAGIMGNFEAESNCEACRLQGDFTADRSKSKAYAQAVMTGAKSAEAFAQDAQGWGLAQWTFWSRKEGLLNACRSRGVNIDDETSQLEWFLIEMQQGEYSACWQQLLSCRDIYSAADVVCRKYEKPAVCNVQYRATKGQEIYNQFHNTPAPDPAPAPAPEPQPIPDNSLRQILIEYLEADIAVKQNILLELKGGAGYG